MCILFVYNAGDIPDSDYMLILASNRDENLDRPASKMAPWLEDPTVIGGRDLEAGCDGGTWLAISPLRKKIGVLLNLPISVRPNAKTRGKLVASYVKSDLPTEEYIRSIKEYAAECNKFNFVAIDLGLRPKIVTYNNLTNEPRVWNEKVLGVSNSLPESPLKKVEGGKKKLEEICTKYKKIEDKNLLVKELIELLKSREQFPRNEIQREKWRKIVATEREDEFFKPNDASVVCSDHFAATDLYIVNGMKMKKKGAVPVLNTNSCLSTSEDIHMQPSTSTDSKIPDSIQPSALIDNNEKHSTDLQSTLNKTNDTCFDLECTDDPIKSPISSELSSVFDTPETTFLKKKLLATHKKLQFRTKENKNLKRRYARLKKKHLPDPVLEQNRTGSYKEYSSIFVYVPEKRYATRTHTIILVSKTGFVEAIEMTMRAPVDLDNPIWDTTVVQADLPIL